MAHNLKLNIWSLQFQDNTDPKDRKKATIEDFFKTFEDFSESGDTKVTKEELFSNFTKEYLKSFNNRFVTDKDKTKAISSTNISNIPRANIIYGKINGGITGIQQEVYELKSNQASGKQIGEDEVSTLPYFFFIWLPYDSDIAYLMTQSYTSMSINQVFLEHFAKFLSQKNILIDKNPYVTQKRIDRFYRDSFVYKVSLFKKEVPHKARSKFNKAFMNEKKVKLNLNLTGFLFPVSTFFKNWSPIKSDLKDLGIENEDDYDLKIYYKDHEGKKANAKIENPKLIMPSIPIPDYVKKNGFDFPDEEEIIKFCKEELEVI